MTFRSRVANSAIWVGSSTIIVKILAFITITLVLARVLEPEDFGLVAIAWLAINSFEFLRGLGIAAALIYRKEDEGGLGSDVAFFALIASSIIIYMVIYVLAPWIEDFFREAEGVTPVLRTLALVIVINGISQVPYTLMAKELDFRNKAIPEIIAGILNSVIAITLALRGYGVWALVTGYLVDGIMRTSLVWFFSSWRPRLRFDWQVFQEMLSYGKHIAGSRLLIFGITNIDDLLIGRVLGATALGFYTLAYRLSNVPATHVTSLVNSVMFPAFSKIQDEKDRIRCIFLDTTHAVGLVSIPLAIGTLVLGPYFVHHYYDGKWDASIVAMEWLVIYGLARSIAANMGNIYRSMGKPQWLTYLAMWRLITMAVLLYPAILWRGIVGVAMLSAVVAVIDFVIAAYLNNRLLGGGYRHYFRRLGPVFLVAGFSAAIAFGFMMLMPSPHRLFPVLTASILMVLVYSLISWRIDPIFRRVAVALINRFGPARRLAGRFGV